MKRSARWIVVLAAIPLLLSIGVSSASAKGGDSLRMQAFSDPNWQPDGKKGSGYSVKSMQPFSDLNWRPSVTTEPAQPEPIGGGTNVPAVALIAGLAALAAGIGAFAATLRLKRVRIPTGA